jgi:hypothetical protein
MIIVVRAMAKIFAAAVAKRSAGNAVASLDSRARITDVLPARLVKKRYLASDFFGLNRAHASTSVLA